MLTDIGRQRLNRGHGYLGRRRWDDVIQIHVGDDGLAEGPWQRAALDREYWRSLEQAFVARVLRRTTVSPTHRGRFKLRPEEATKPSDRIRLVFLCIVQVPPDRSRTSCPSPAVDHISK